MKKIYLALCILGTILPLWFFIPYVASHGVANLVADSFANGAAATFTADVLVSSLVLWVFIYHETRTRRVRLWWLAILGNVFVGVSLGLPLFLLLREVSPREAPE